MRPHLPRFLIERGAAPGAVLALRPDEAKHARVRRLGVGDAVAVFDGAGRSYLARIESLSRDGAAVRIESALPERAAESPLDLTLAVGTLKADRFDWVIEKATELGVTRIQPFISTHTLARPSADRQARWRQIALAAAKQCGRSAAPAIAGTIDFDAVVALPAALRLVFAEDGSGVELATLTDSAPTSLLIVIGAEGGFTPAELATARAQNCHLVDLGPRILRADTAALTALSLCQARWGDLGGAGCAGAV